MLPRLLLPPDPTLIRIQTKFELSLEVDKPKFEKDHEYVDYALSVLERSLCHPIYGPMLNDLECRSTTLSKSVASAEHFRLLGNSLFKGKSMADALNAYTLSIAFSPPGSSQLALAYGNRSVLLFNKKYYRECLEDVERALEMNYPEDKKYKLIKRQAEAKKLLPTQKKVTYHGAVPTITNRNPTMPSAADSIKINENKEYGRHIIATRTINPGEVLLVEKPYSCFVSFSGPKDVTYCTECAELCYNLIPCNKCAGVLYCSKECRKRAFVAYHRYECTIMTTFGYDIINWNATRMTLKALREFDTKETDTTEYRSDRYLELSKLSYHKGDSIPDTFVSKAAGAAKAFYALKKYTDIFAELDMDDEENVLKTLLFKNACVDKMHGLMVEMTCGAFGRTIGFAMYSVAALLNHACAENAEGCCYGSTMVVKATKMIQKGQQCFINYGTFPTKQPVQVRREYLRKNFYFTCKCLACEQNWPIATERLVEDPLVSSLRAINNEVIFSENLSKQQKSVLLDKTIQAAKKAEQKYPFLTYLYCFNIYQRVLFDGNQYTSF